METFIDLLFVMDVRFKSSSVNNGTFVVGVLL